MKTRIFIGFFFIVLFISATSMATAETSFVDRSGNRIVVTKPFHRIISLYGAHSENLFSLGLDKEVIGVSKNEAYPPLALTKPVFSYHDDAEKFLAAKPDLVLIRPMIARGYPNLVEKLEHAGVCVVSLQPNTVEEMFLYWKKLGMLTGREKEAYRMITKFKEELTRIKKLVAKVPLSERKKVYFESIHSKMKTFAPTSIAIFALESAGGINVADDAVGRHGSNIAAYGKERILSHAHEIDVYLAQRGAMNHVTLRRIKEEGGFEAIKAVREGNIFIIDEKIVSRPTMRLLDGIYEIGRFLYPSVFNDVSVFLSKPVITRAAFAEMFVKMMNIPIKTPDYRHDIAKRPKTHHRYGDFKDVDYRGNSYKFIETAVYRGLFPNIKKDMFYPDQPVKKSTVAYALFMHFDFPEVTAKVNISDVKASDPLFEQIRTAVGLHIMPVDSRRAFLPQGHLSGRQIYEILEKAKQIANK